MKPYAIGADIGGTAVKIGLFGEDGSLLCDREIPTRCSGGGAMILPDIAQALDAMLHAAGIKKDLVEGVGIGVPGPVDENGVVNRCVNLGWGIEPVKARLEALSGLSVHVENDANLAALGELTSGGGKGYQSIVLLTLGTGIGGGIILHGKIYGGFHGASGEIGHIPVCEEETEICTCGGKGCLEYYASARGIVRVAERILDARPDEESVLRSYATLSAREIFAADALGDKAAKDAVEETCRYLGRGMATIACVLDPEAFVIGGGMSAAGERLLFCLQKMYRKYAFHAHQDTTITLAGLGNRAGIYGGAALVFGKRKESACTSTAYIGE